ncbi:MAG: hypothetical protein IRY97_02450, partial [Thermomicrobiaceae bacterium]|nr:hypothetical protein [Thermomicrobiaceae bacterium]
MQLPEVEPTIARVDIGGLAARPAPAQGQLATAWRRFRRNRLAVAGGVVVLLIVLVAALAPVLAPHDPAEQFADGLTLDGLPVPSTLPGSTQFILGTDQNGRDLLSRILWGAR